MNIVCLEERNVPTTTRDIVKWDARYEIGVGDVDEQHRMLFDIINDIWAAQVRGADRDELLDVVRRLERYTVAHFTAEGTLMSAVEYPQLDAHKVLHRQFVERVREEGAAVRAKGVVSLDLLHFLQDWLIEHILHVDTQYATFMTVGKKSGFSIRQMFARFLG